MSNHDDSAQAVAAHKRKLIAQGELYRVGIVHARAHVSEALRPNSLLQGVVEHAVGFASNRVESLMAPGGLRLQGVMPYALTILSFIARKKLVKPAIGIAVAAAVAVNWLSRRKR